MYNDLENKDNNFQNKKFQTSLKEEIEKKNKKIQVDLNKNYNKKDKPNLNQKEHILINNEEINIFNKYINEISTNENNRRKLFELEKEIMLKNEKMKALEEKIQECLKNKESIINRIENEKQELKRLLDMEIQKSLKFKEYAEEEKKKHIKYKTKLQQYKRKSKTLEKEIETITTSNNDYYIYKKGEMLDDSKHSYKLREEIYKLNQQLDEEKNKSELLKILAENEKEKIENYKDKYNKTKKFNDTLLNKLKQKEKAASKELEDENYGLKKKIVENKNEIDELKNEIKKLRNEIESYQKEFKLIDIKEKSIIKENKELRNYLNEKEDIIRKNSNKLNEINLKYKEEKNKNQRLSLEIKELFYQNKRLKFDTNMLTKSNKDLNEIQKTSNYKIDNKNFKKKSKIFGTMLCFSLDEKKNIGKNQNQDNKQNQNQDKSKKPIKNILKKTLTINNAKTVKLNANKSNIDLKRVDFDNFNKRKSNRKSLNIGDKRSSKRILKILNGDYISSSAFSSSDKSSEIDKKTANNNGNISNVEKIAKHNSSYLYDEKRGYNEE